MGKFRPTQANIIGRHARKAATIIEERGWVQGMLENEQGQVCLMGAFDRAVSPIHKTQRLALGCVFTTRFGQWMEEHYPDDAPVGSYGWRNAPAWNDGVFKTQEETVSWLTKFADDLDPQR